MAMDDEAFYNRDFISCDDFEDDTHKIISSMHEEMKKISIKNKDLKSNSKSL